MSGIQMAAMGFGGSSLHANPAFSANLTNVSINTGTRQAGLNFQTDGTTTISESPSPGTSSANNWYTPTTSSIGTSFWVKCTATGSNFSLGGSSANVWVQLSSARNATINNSTTASVAIGTMVVNFSTDGGSTTSDSYNVDFHVGYEP